MVRFRRDVGALFNFIKTSAILHQAQRRMDEKAGSSRPSTTMGWRYPIFCKAMSQVSGKAVTDNVRMVVRLISERAKRRHQSRPGEDEVQAVRWPASQQEVTLSASEIGTAIGIGTWGAC